MKYVIVGGVAGGATTAARLRRLDEDADIVIFEKGAHISYANCGLPYYIGDTIKERKQLFLQTPDSFGARFNVDVRVNTEVLSIDRSKKCVHVRNGRTQKEYDELYDKLVLAPGAVPVRPALEGVDLPRIYTLRSVSDTDHIKEIVASLAAQTVGAQPSAVVVGAGFVGLEMVENLCRVGFSVSLVEMADYIMPMADYPVAAPVQSHLRAKGVKLYLRNSVTAFAEQSGKTEVRLRNGETLAADLVLLSVGVKPLTDLPRQAGLELGERGGIKVNGFMQTSDPNIYAVGDAVEFPHPLTGHSMLCYLAGPANKQARICADNLVLGNVKQYKGSVGTAIAKVFDMTVGMTGLSENFLVQSGMPYQTAVIHAASHASYYPDAHQMVLKINFNPTTGQLLGGQAAGFEGVDKRVDMMASVISARGTVYDLIDIEHAYAPPFSSAKDPVTVAGYVAENILTGKMLPMKWSDLKQRIDEGEDDLFVIDVRSALECKQGTIPGAVNYPLDELREFLDEIPTDKTIVTYCAIGLRSYLAARILVQSGFEKVYTLSGGYKTYSQCVAELNK